MERTGLALLLVMLAVLLYGCGGSDDVYWRLQTNFGLTAEADGRWTKAQTGAVVQVALRTDDPERWTWTLSHYDDEHFRPLDYWSTGEEVVWRFEARSPGETWLSFSTASREEGGPHPEREITPYFEIR